MKFNMLNIAGLSSEEVVVNGAGGSAGATAGPKRKKASKSKKTAKRKTAKKKTAKRKTVKAPAKRKKARRR